MSTITVRYVHVQWCLSLLDDECATEDDGWLIDAVVLVTADPFG